MYQPPFGKPPNEVIGHVTVPKESLPFVTHRYETASAWDKLQAKPGRYEIRRDSRSGLTYMASARIECVRLEDYYVNRLFTASSVSHNVYDEPRDDTYSWSVYDYQLDKHWVDTHGWLVEPTQAWLSAKAANDKAYAEYKEREAQSA